MAVQTTINRYPAAAVAGDRAGQEPIVHTPYNCTAEDVTSGSTTTHVTVGNFVWAGTAGGQVNGATAATAATDKPLGLVERLFDHFNYELKSDGTMEILDGQTVTVVVEGDMYAKTATAATVGQKVFANTTTGAVHPGTAGGTVASCVETMWFVKSAGAIGDVIIIGTSGQAPEAAGA